jgi:Asp-tRNA(Asn)/Glu-tRNA(Gln) amidotransferase A subunit family amidase
MISAFGEIHNPWDTSRIAGGSSGGSAASVATGLGFAAIGTDTAGSIRLPAAYCGVVGLKPTYGRVSARGVIPLSWTLDHIGPIANSVTDAALILQVIAGYDPGDPASADVPVPDFGANLGKSVKSLRMAVPRAFFFDELNPEVANAIEQAIVVFAKLGVEIRDVTLEVPTDRTVSTAESYAFHEEMLAKNPEGYQPATLGRIRAGADISAPVALRARRDVEAKRHATVGIFTDTDVILTPTVPFPPPVIEDLRKHPENLRPTEIVLLRNTRPFNIWGIPAISVPCGFTNDGLPIGLQLAAAPWREDLLLQAAHAYEQASDRHTRVPIN